MNEVQRKALIAEFRKLQSELRTFQSDISRFERELIQNNILDVVKKVAATTTKTAKAVSTKPKREVRISGKVPRDPMYDLELEFSNNGESWANPLVNPTAGGTYFVRLRLRQHQAEPLLQGFKLAWTKPTGWTWVDGLSTTTYEEAASNPMVVARVATAPSTARGGSFRIVVQAHYYG
jgi:hypothetical protein